MKLIDSLTKGKIYHVMNIESKLIYSDTKYTVSLISGTIWNDSNIVVIVTNHERNMKICMSMNLNYTGHHFQEKIYICQSISWIGWFSITGKIHGLFHFHREGFTATLGLKMTQKIRDGNQLLIVSVVAALNILATMVYGLMDNSIHYQLLLK